MAFLDQFIAFSREPAKQSELFAEWMAERPRELFQELRVSQPILVLPGRVLVTKYHDVIDVLARDEEFGVDLYAPKMRRATGDFFLGMEDSARYEREVSIVRLASGRDDLPRLERSLSAWTDELLSERAATGQLDIVSDLARRVPARLVAEYFGASGVEEPRLLGWLRALFRDIFLIRGIGSRRWPQPQPLHPSSLVGILMR
jgi:cytochrome P450